MLNSSFIKKEFPLFSQPQYQDLVYLDSSATTQKPQKVISAINDFYFHNNANPGRSVHTLAQESTKILTESRQTIASFFGAKDQELILTRNTTEAINGVALGWARHQVNADDVILSSLLEHHSNFVVWQQVCAEKNAKLELATLTADGQINISDLEQKLKQHSPKLLALTHLSNVTGGYLDLHYLVKMVKKTSPTTRILIDGAQSAGRIKIDFDQLGIDFYAFSGHKMYGPMGIGGLLVKEQILREGEMKPWLFGGGMIDEVHPQFSTFHADSQQRFTAGTVDVASTVGLATACTYLLEMEMNEVLEHEQQLARFALEKLGSVNDLEVCGPSLVEQLGEYQLKRFGPVSFFHHKYQAHDIAQVLNHHHIAVRSGHHCCMPLHSHYHWPATVRVSFGVYSDQKDIEKLIDVVTHLNRYLG
ncbi:MAG: cysteine desulfurase SufS subfamily [Microgenomates bacterium 39_7]|nr:MAG: cysteine desulfurase SufS subfamily [Microgenomates bacterium 39_7]